jgi:hypothetical protein
LPGEEIAEDRLPVGFRDAGLDEGAAGRSEIVDHKIHGDIIDALRKEFGHRRARHLWTRRGATVADWIGKPSFMARRAIDAHANASEAASW